jgi:hypothetical protein
MIGYWLNNLINSKNKEGRENINNFGKKLLLKTTFEK